MKCKLCNEDLRFGGPPHKCSKIIINNLLQPLINGDFLGAQDPNFNLFTHQMPDKHWSKYDLSAVRLGWEAYKLLQNKL